MPSFHSAESPAKDNILQGLVFLAAVVTRLPALGSWWCLDDWGQLGGVAGLVSHESGARWLSQVLWWDLTGGIGGLDPHYQTWFRILIHGLAATSVFRIGKSLQVSMTARTFAGVIFAATPVAFTVLFWASGIQELLAGCLALLAIERWLHGGVANALGALALGTCSLLAKESGFGLPFLFLLLTILGRAGSAKEFKPRLAITGILFAALVLEGLLVLRHFARDAGDPYQLGGIRVILGNLGMYGWWLVTQGPVFASRITVAMAGLGIGLFGAWAFWATLSWRKKRDLPLVLGAWGILALGPALVLVRQAHPYLAYVTVAPLALAIGSLLPRRWTRTWVLAVVVLLGGAWGYHGMRVRIVNLTDKGAIADPVVRAAHLAKESAVALSSQQPPFGEVSRCRTVILQPPISKPAAARADREGPGFIEESPRYAALGGSVGPALILGCRTPVPWVNSLVGVDPDCRVFCETGKGLIAWGDTWSALLYSVLLDISLGHFDRAAEELAAAAAIDPEFSKFEFERSRIPGWNDHVAVRMEEFGEWARTETADRTPGGRDCQGLEDLILGLRASMHESIPAES